MEVGILVKHLLLALGLGSGIIFCLNLPVFAQSDSQRQQIRFYKINKHEQTARIRFTAKKARASGCHNFLKKTRVFKAIQFGFESCELYSKKDCPIGSEILVTREKNPEPTNLLTQGFGWLPESEHKRGAKLRSWSCQ